MSDLRRPRPVGARAALVGLLAAVGLVGGTTSGLALLVDPAARLAAVESPAEPEPVALPDECPDRTELAQPVAATADELVECPRSFHGLDVTYTGEAVRAVLDHGRWAWLHLNDDPYALEAGPVAEHRTAIGGNSGVPVRVPSTVAEHVDTVGDARHHGTIVEVRGRWHVDGAGDGGPPGIRADTLDVVEAGRAVEQPSDPLRAVTAATLAAATAALLAGSWLHRRWRDPMG